MDTWKNKQKIIIQLVCVLLSLGLWIYVTNIDNPIKSYELKNVPVEILNSNPDAAYSGDALKVYTQESGKKNVVLEQKFNQFN